MTPLFVCAQDSWVVLLSSPLLESGSVQHVIEEDAGLLIELAFFAWHRGQLEAPLRFSLSQGGAIRGKGVLWEESLSAVPISVPLNEGHLHHLMLPVSQVVGAPFTDINRRQPQPSNRSDATSILELLKGLNVPAEILEMVSNKLNLGPPEPKPEELLLDMRLKIDSKRVTGLRV